MAPNDDVFWVGAVSERTGICNPLRYDHEQHVNTSWFLVVDTLSGGYLPWVYLVCCICLNRFGSLRVHIGFALSSNWWSVSRGPWEKVFTSDSMVNLSVHILWSWQHTQTTSGKYFIERFNRDQNIPKRAINIPNARSTTWRWRDTIELVLLLWQNVTAPWT